MTLTGCGASPPDREGPLLHASVLQQRSDVAERQAQVRLRNDGDDPITIASVEVDDPRFDGVAVRVVDRTSTLGPGDRVDVRVQLPAMDCAAEDEARPTVTVELDGDSTRAVTVEAEDPLGFLAPLHERECFAASVAEVARVTITAFTPSPPGRPGALALSVVPTGSGSVRLETVDSTPLLTFAGLATAGPFPLGIDVVPDSPPTTLTVPLVPQRCDPHVVQEDKRGTVFTVDAAVDGVPGEFDLPAAPDMKADMLTWVAAWCGFGAAG